MFMQNLAGQTRCKLGDVQRANCFFNFLSGFPSRGWGAGGGGGWVSFGGLLRDKVLLGEVV